MDPHGPRAYMIYNDMLMFLKDEHWEDIGRIPSYKLYNMFVERRGYTDLDGKAADTVFRIIEDVRCDRSSWEMNKYDVDLVLSQYR